MTIKKFFIFCICFISLGALANWFWFPEYLFIGVSAIIMCLIFVGIIIALRNSIKDK